MKIGFVGLGIMGKAMVENLIKAEIETNIFDINEEAVEKLVKIGGIKCSSLSEVAINSDIIITMLPAGRHVKSVLFGEEGLSKYLDENKIFVDMSSTSVNEAKEMSTELKSLGVSMLDAPVSGGEPLAIKGELSIMVGGERDTFEKVLPIFEVLGGKTVHIGESGTGQIAKLANQIIVSTNLAALSEACVFASKAGVDLNNLYEAINGGLAGSAVLDAKMPSIIEGNFKPGGKIETNYKDLGNIQLSANILGVPLPVTNLVKEIFSSEVQNGNSGKDHSYIINYFEKMSNHKIPTK